jgi:hypothetical protein
VSFPSKSDGGPCKSILSSFIVEYIQQDSNITASYYFCNHRMAAKNTAVNVLCTLAVQILHRNRDIVPLVYRNFFKQGKGKATQTMTNMLKDILEGVACTRVVIDGLDECEESAQRELIRGLSNISEEQSHSFKVLFCSRLSNDPKSTILLRGETDDAIKLYVKKEVSQLC